MYHVALSEHVLKEMTRNEPLELVKGGAKRKSCGRSHQVWGQVTGRGVSWEGGKWLSGCRLVGRGELAWRHMGAILILKEPDFVVYGLKQHEKN